MTNYSISIFLPQISSNNVIAFAKPNLSVYVLAIKEDNTYESLDILKQVIVYLCRDISLYTLYFLFN